MSVRKIAVIGTVVVVGMILLYSWFGSSSNTRHNGNDKNHHLDEQRWEKVERILELLQRAQKTEEAADEKLERIQQDVRAVMRNEEFLKENAIEVQGLDQKLNEGGEKVKDLLVRVEGELDTLTEKQRTFLMQLEQKINDILEKSETGSRVVNPPPAKNDVAKPKKPSSIQDEIEKLYEQADKEDQPKKTNKNADEVEEVDLSTNAKTDPAHHVDKPKQTDAQPTEINDASGGIDGGCWEDEIEALMIKGIPALINHDINSRCLFLNGRPSLYCNKTRLKEEDWFQLPVATTPSDPSATTKALPQFVLDPESDDPTPIKYVALASMVRTGNSWMRRLVEASSGIITEAAYKREGTPTAWGTARKVKGHSGFAKRGFKPGENVFVKTHHADGRFPWSKVVRLIRFPLDIEPWMRFTKNLKQEQPLEHFKNSFAHEYLDWHSKWNCWQGDQLIVRYEDLVENTECVLKEILDFLEYEYTDATIQLAVKTFPPSDLTEREKNARPLGWDVPSAYLDYASQLFSVVIKEFGYQSLFDEVLSWREEKGV